LVSIGQHWSALVSIGQHWSALVSIGQHWSALSALVSIGQHWSALSLVGQRVASSDWEQNSTQDSPLLTSSHTFDVSAAL
jgi:hypothetical protein